MRLWSIHPKYLDTKGLTAVWREALLAKKVLENKTKGYKNHPQLIRFKKSKFPLIKINFYLQDIWEEANTRGYKFDEKKFERKEKVSAITVKKGQVEYEFHHLLRKLQTRDIEKFEKIKYIDDIEVHPLFKIVEGGIEKWEKT